MDPNPLIIGLAGVTVGWLFGIYQTNSCWILRADKNAHHCRGKFYNIELEKDL